MSASPTSPKELSALLRRCAAAIETPSQLTQEELDQVAEDAEYAADELDRGRGVPGA